MEYLVLIDPYDNCTTTCVLLVMKLSSLRIRHVGGSCLPLPFSLTLLLIFSTLTILDFFNPNFLPLRIFCLQISCLYSLEQSVLPFLLS